ncbi:MAG: hypothetical protein HRU23_12480 [Gammaproteobacteria bacterium]|nr:hypothetical protein [Gammaproteobacteria bacterium]
MKFTLLTSALLSLTLIATPQAIAGQNNHNSHNNHNNYSKYGNHHKYQHGHHYKHRINNQNRHKRHSHHRNSNIIGGVIGGVILGAIIHDAVTQPSHHRVTKTYTTYPANKLNYYSNPSYNNGRYNQHSTISSNSIVIANSATTTYRVINGNQCFLTNTNKFGNEVLTQVPKVNCGF